MTTPANVADSSVALQLLSETNKFISILECYFIADKGYAVKDIYNKVNPLYQGNCFIPLNSRGAKKNVMIPASGSEIKIPFLTSIQLLTFAYLLSL